MEVQGKHGEWSTGFCDCFSDCSNCCITYWCPCITFGQTAEIIDEGSTSCVLGCALFTLLCCFTGCGQNIYSFIYQSKIRKQYNIEGSDCGDCCKHFCCQLCALTQVYRELKNRGFDVPLGWQANVERQNRGGVTMGAPVVEGGMKR